MGTESEEPRVPREETIGTFEYEYRDIKIFFKNIYMFDICIYIYMFDFDTHIN